MTTLIHVTNPRRVYRKPLQPVPQAWMTQPGGPQTTDPALICMPLETWYCQHNLVRAQPSSPELPWHVHM